MSAVIDRNTVFGNITFEEGSLAVPLIVRAFDKDMVNEELLGEDGPISVSYRISYSDDSFGSAERKSADIIVRAFNEDGEMLAESNVHHNVARNQRIDLIIAARHDPQEPPLSELELLQASIEDLRENVDYWLFTNQQITHLIEETISRGIIGELRRRVVQQRLEFLRLAAQFEHETDIVLAAFYGWFRLDQPQSLNELLVVPIGTLRETLQAAISRNIIPDIAPQVDDILERIRSLRFDRGRLVNHRFVAQLIDVETERPLSGYLIEITDLDSEPDEQSLGSVITDSLGVFTLVFNLPVDAPEDASRRLQLGISDDGFAVAETELEVRLHQDRVDQVRVSLRENERTEQPIEEVAPLDMAERLRQRGIRTLGDLINNPDIEDEADPEAFERLRGMAKFAALAPDLDDDKREFLLDQGYRSLLDVADQSRAGFVRDHHEGLNGDAAAYANFRAAEKTTQLYQLMLNDAWFKLATPDDDEPEDPDIPTGVNETLDEFKKCCCRDCDSAVSPAAYLAHLLQWTLKHIKDGEASISLAVLNRTADRFGLGQPFADLPASCDAVEDRVRQVRICVEVLWGFTGLLELTDLQMPTSFRNAYRHLRNQLYRDILTNLGAGFEQLRVATLNIEGNSLSAEQVETQRRSVAARLGINEERLDDLFFNVEQPPISPSEIDLERLFGFKNTRAEDVFAAPARPQLADWQLERLEAVWQQQDWILDGYSGDERLPFVDPALIDESYLRTPLEENAAFTLLEARRETLASHREGLVAANPQQNGLADLLADELGQTIDVLRDLFAALQTTDQPEATEQALDTLSSLNLTPAGFTQLMGIDALLAAGRPIAATQAEIDAAWEAVFDILSRSHRHSLFPSWVTEEEGLELVFGPKLFWMPVTQAPPNPWQASASERTDWEEALRSRSRRPIIDPDQITTQHIIMIAVLMLPSSPPVITDLPPTAFQRWEERRTWVNDRVAALRQAREGQPTRLDTLQAVLDASTLNINLDVLTELADSEAEGIDIQPRLAQLSLSLPGYRFLANIHLLAEGNATISADKWDEVVGILVQGEKVLEFTEWREDEQESEIILHPQRFLLPAKEPEIDDSSQNRWLHDTLALQQWKTTLKARSDQLLALTEALSKAVDVAAQKTLPLLRNILIMEAGVPGEVTTFDERADWLDKRLLIDMRMDGCHLTTRVSQAIETLQRLIRGVYTEEHIPELQHLTLDAEEDYESDWSVIGSYPTWKAYMLAYLFPENLLHNYPRMHESYGFQKYVKKKKPSTAAEACQVAKDYSDYFNDVRQLEIQATCQFETSGSDESECKPSEGKTSRMYLFAVPQSSRTVYSANFRIRNPDEDSMSTWQPITDLDTVEHIIGAVPHITPSNRQYILLFVKARIDNKLQLQYKRYDLVEEKWQSKLRTLKLPGDGIEFTAITIQKRTTKLAQKFFPTLLAIRRPDGQVFLRSLDGEANGWDAEGWTSVVAGLMQTRLTALGGLVQQTEKKYLLFMQEKAELSSIKYRQLHIEKNFKQDFGWRHVAFGEYVGAVQWLRSGDIFLFFQDSEVTNYKEIRESSESDTVKLFSSLLAWNDEFLEPNFGIGLRQIQTDSFAGKVGCPVSPPIWSPTGDRDNLIHVGPLHPNVISGAQAKFYLSRPFPTTSLYDFFSLVDDINFVFETRPATETQIYYRVQLLYWAIEGFKDYLDRIRYKVFEGKADILPSEQAWSDALIATEEATGKSFSISGLQWNAVRPYLLELSEIVFEDAEGNALVSAIDGKTILLQPPNQIPDLEHFEFKLPKSNFGSERFMHNGRWGIPPLGGHIGPVPDNRFVTVVASSQKGCLRITLQRAGDILEGRNLKGLDPRTNGPSTLVPDRTHHDLQRRRRLIRQSYRGLAYHTSSTEHYLYEAYNTLPIYLGLQLQRNGFFEEALLWYRQVFDYLQVKDKRKIDYSLHLEQKLELTFDNAEDWLNDSSNPHSIAATRKNTYTRHILQLIIRCLIDYADQLFTNDNVTDNARARELYALALKLLDLKALRLGISACADILGELEVEVVESGQLPLAQFTAVLDRIQNPDRLNSLVTNLMSIDQDTNRRLDARVTDMREAVTTALADIPAPKRMAAVLDTKEQTLRTAENYYLAHKPSRILLEKSYQNHQDSELAQIAEIARVSEDILIAEPTELNWLRSTRTGNDENEIDFIEAVFFEPDSGNRSRTLAHVVDALPMASLIATQNNGFSVADGISFDFCIPQNPVILALRSHAENNLLKLRTCRNIAGFVRPLDPYGAPIGIGSAIVSPDGSIFSGIVKAPPTIYRYSALIARVKELITITQQIESGYQLALEKAENEALTVLQAEQSVELAGAKVILQDLRINQANSQLGLAGLQKNSAVLRESTFSDWISAGMNAHEANLLAAYRDAGEAQQAANAARTIGQIAAATASAIEGATKTFGANLGVRVVQSLAATAEGIATGFAINAQTRAQVESFEASFERRNDEWQLQQAQAAKDVQISDQQILLAQDSVAISLQERTIAGLEQTHAADTLEFLTSKFFSEETYRWIASVLQDVYRFFLQEASSIAGLAEMQLAFERQEAPLKIIQSNYWNIPNEASGAIVRDNTDRLGLTGSARLLKDIYQLDQYAFETRQRKQTLSITLDLAQLFPLEFQRFRETGVLVFETPLSLIDRQMPGYYLCLIQQVTVSVVALIPPGGIFATLTSAGTSRTVVGGDTFQTVTIQNQPERIALTAPATTSGNIDLQPDAQSLLNPFEGSGFDMFWELLLPMTSNPWDYNTMATVLFTVNFTALHSYDYERQVIENLDPTVSYNRAFDFRQVFADPWYDLNNHDQSDTPMTVRFETRRSDFPTNLTNVVVQHVVLYFVRKDGETFEQEVQYLHFTPDGATGFVGGPASSVDGRISTRSGNGTNWLPMIGLAPYGQWELAFPDNPPADTEARDRFANELIENLLLVITFSGRLPNWPI